MTWKDHLSSVRITVNLESQNLGHATQTHISIEKYFVLYAHSEQKYCLTEEVEKTDHFGNTTT